jgi:hypothetical protein
MAAIDSFGSLQPSIDGDITHLALVTTDDVNDLAFVSRAIYITVAGTLKVTTLGGETITIPSGALAVGAPHPIRATRIWATGTTATGIMVGW